MLILIMPAMNATSKQSFSSLHCINIYLRSTMTQNRLNNLLLLYVHEEYTDFLDLKSNMQMQLRYYRRIYSGSINCSII